MNRSGNALLCLVMAAALCLLAVLASDYLRDTRELRALEVRLEESRSAWEATAAAKEELEDELAQVNSDLREASLTIEESATRAASLRQDIEELEQQISELK